MTINLDYVGLPDEWLEDELKKYLLEASLGLSCQYSVALVNATEEFVAGRPVELPEDLDLLNMADEQTDVLIAEMKRRGIFNQKLYDDYTSLAIKTAKEVAVRLATRQLTEAPA